MEEIIQTQEETTTEEQVSEGLPAEALPVEEISTEETLVSEDNGDLLTEDAHEHLTDDQIKKLDNLLSTLKGGINIMAQDWMATAKEYNIGEKEMIALGKYNVEHATAKPDNLTEEEEKDWDYMNGINNLTEDEVKEIFPDPNHPIYGITFDITKDRIHDICREYFEYTSMKKEYAMVHDQYSRLLEENEEAHITMQRVLAEAEPNPEVKAAKIAAIENYYSIKYLKWMRDPIDPQQKNAIIKALSDANKIMYYNNRCKAKLEQMEISPMIILEINKFENNHLPDKYWPNQGVLVLYFMTLVAFANISKPLSDDSNKIRCMVLALDRYIRKSAMTDKERDEITQSVIGLEEQFLGLCPVAEKPHVDTPPTTDIPEVVE